MKESADIQLTNWMRSSFQAAYPALDLAQIKVAVEPATQPQFGDYQCNAAFEAAKIVKSPPRAVAAKIIAAAPKNDCVAKLDIAGAGFINITLADEWLARQIEAIARDPAFGVPAIGAGRPVCIDYSGPNVAKPMHVGHIRSTVIGNALDRTLRFLGYRVIADNHFGDWGTQFGVLIMGYRNFLDQDALQNSPVEELERVYVKSYEKATQDSAWMDQCRQELVKLQAGDKDNAALWREFVSLSKVEFDKIYRRLGVKFELSRGESYYNARLPGLVEMLKKQNIVRESEGAQVAFFDETCPAPDGKKLPPAIVQKSDGGYNYLSTDLATVRTRVEEFNPEMIIYVTDERQQLHFAQLFAVCRRLGCKTNLRHVWFGLMRLPQGTFSTREGNVIRLEKLLDEAESRALAVAREINPDMPADQQKEVARAIGIGAVKYADLSQNPQSVVTFTWDKALALNGNSAPYLQYTYARIRSVEQKYLAQYSGEQLESAPIVLKEPQERRLAVQLVRFAEIVPQAARLFKPSIIADYLYQLAGIYNPFYQNVPFLKSPDGVRESRIRLGNITAAVLRKGLDLLGIETPERI
jgi:arginyl-tRNA synthetase